MTLEWIFFPSNYHAMVKAIGNNLEMADTMAPFDSKYSEIIFTKLVKLRQFSCDFDYFS